MQTKFYPNHPIHKELQKRILILDGAMGTMIQRRRLAEADFRGKRFESHPVNLMGNNDILSLTRPDIIQEIHEAYLQAGADIIETNTFNANGISMQDYRMEDLVYELNYESARLARAAVDTFNRQNPDKPRFAAGSMGPTNRTLSMSPKVDDPAYRAVQFDEMVQAYYEQIRGLTEGGADLLLIETIFDTLNAKAALYAAEQYFEESGKRLPIMLSVTVVDLSGRTLSGQTLEAFWISIKQYDFLSAGINCSLGPRQMRPFLEELSNLAHVYTTLYPNAGLPNEFGAYDETPKQMGDVLKEYAESGYINILGGCCGTTPDHIQYFADVAANLPPRRIPDIAPQTQYSGLEVLTVKPENNFVNIGERCNVTGSRKFSRLIREEEFDAAVQIAQQQVDDGEALFKALQGIFPVQDGGHLAGRGHPGQAVRPPLDHMATGRVQGFMHRNRDQGGGDPMAADIEHIQAQMIRSQRLGVEKVAADDLAGGELPGQLHLGQAGQIVRQQSALDAGGGLEVLVQAQLLFQKLAIGRLGRLLGLVDLDLRPLQLGDVGGDAADAVGLAAGVAQGKLG